MPVAASTRRIATVVSSVPDATSARSSTSRLAAPPVPMISRDAIGGRRPPADRRVGPVVHHVTHLPAPRSAPRRGAVGQLAWPPTAARDDLALHRHGHAGPRRPSAPSASSSTPVGELAGSPLTRRLMLSDLLREGVGEASRA